MIYLIITYACNLQKNVSNIEIYAKHEKQRTIFLYELKAPQFQSLQYLIHMVNENEYATKHYR